MTGTALARFRICDFGGVLAGAGATRILSAFGAQVIRIEDPTNQGRWDVIRGAPPHKDGKPGRERGGGFINHNAQKLGITLNLKAERGKQLFRQLVAVSDAVTENFAAGVMERLGFDYEQLRVIRPDIVYVSNCGFGHTGPYVKFKSWGPIVQAMSGLTFTSGLRDQAPAGWGYSYMDHTGAYYMAMALLMALYHRERSGEGQWIDLAMTEAGTTLNGPALLDYTVNGRALRRQGMPDSNRSQWPRMAPHGIYPTQGEDAWVAISCRDDLDWKALRQVVAEGWTGDGRYVDLDGRIASEDSLDEQLASWTRRCEKFDVEARLQAAGVPAAAVQTPPERIDHDANTEAWGLWPEVEHPVIGKQRIDGLPVHLSETDWRFSEGGPLLGQHNQQIYGELLGLDANEIAELTEEGVI